MSLLSVIQTALGEVGYMEDPPGSNKTKYGVEYELNGVPWCAIFTWWVFKHAGESSKYYGGNKTASCGELLTYYQGLGKIISSPVPGCIAIMNFRDPHTQDTDHCGIVIGYSGGDTFESVDGNTSPPEGSQIEGEGVYRKTRNIANVVAFCDTGLNLEVDLRDYIVGHGDFYINATAYDVNGTASGYSNTVLYSIGNIGNLSNWSFNRPMSGITNSYVNGINDFTIYPIGEYDQLYIAVPVEQNQDYRFSFRTCSPSGFTYGGYGEVIRPFNHEYAYVGTSAPVNYQIEPNSVQQLGATSYLNNNPSDIPIQYTVDFNSGSLSVVYLVMSYAYITDYVTVSFRYSDIHLIKI